MKKKIFGVPGIPRNQKIGVKFWKMIFKENTLRVILRPFWGKSDVKWVCDTTYKSENAKYEIRLVPPPLKFDNVLGSIFMIQKGRLNLKAVKGQGSRVKIQVGPMYD